MPSTSTRLHLNQKGALPGYHLRDPDQTRRKALDRLLTRTGKRPIAVKKRLNVLRIYHKYAKKLRAMAQRRGVSRKRAQRLQKRARRNHRLCRRLTRDMRYLDKKYIQGGATTQICQ